MTVGKAIYNLLLSNADLRAIVDTRIFPEVAQQDAVLPYVVYNVSSNEPSDTKREPSKLDTAQIEVNLYSTSYTECIDMATHTRAALDRVTGTYSGVNVQSIQYLGEIIDFDEAQRTYNITADYDVRISRTDFEIAQGSPITGVTLGELSDVDVTGVTDGQLIAYDATANEWQPADDAGGVTQLGQLTDVQFGQGGPETGELLKYDGSEWTNDNIVKSEVGLGNVDNTSDAAKPVSTATQTELNAKANSADFSNVDNTSDADKPVSTATQTALNAKADTSAVPTDLNDLSDVTIVGTPAGNQALIYDATAGAFKSLVSYTNRFEDEVETGLQMPSVSFERGYSVKSEGDGIFIDPSSDTPAAGKVIVRKIYHKTGFISDDDVIGDYTLIHTFADDTAYADTVAVFDAFEDGATYGTPPFTLAQSWVEEDAAPSFVGLLNETYGSGAEAAYSTRRLNGNVTECMVIRRTSDSTTTTIGFDVNNDIDEAAIETFCTGTTCTVSEWKDQSGNGNDATQSTPGDQPTIYTGGAIVKENGRVSIDFANNQILEHSTFLSAGDDVAISFVASNLLGEGSKYYFYTDSNTGWHFLRTVDANANPGVNGGLSLTNYRNGTLSNWTSRGYAYDEFKTGQNLSFSQGSVTTSQTGPTAIIGNRTLASSQHIRGDLQELIFFTADKSTVRTDIEENIGDYYTQNTPLLDTYSGAAAAYSLRKLRTAYTGDAIEVYNGTAYADIGFNVFGELDTVGLADHCGSNDGFIRTWYDQAGSNDATQSTTANMPKIYDGTTGVVTENGKPAVEFDGSNDGLAAAQSLGITTTHAAIFVTYTVDASATGTFFSLQQGNSAGIRGQQNSATNYRFEIKDPLGNVTLQTSDTAGQKVKSHFLIPNSQEIFSNGSNVKSGTTAYSDYHFYTPKIGLRNNDSYFLGKVQEFVVYDSNETDNRAGIETNINTFYDIYS